MGSQTGSTELAPVLHLMRTYGVNGGEQQLSQYFGAEPRGLVRESFAFVHADPDCSKLFAERAPELEQIVLSARPVEPGSAWQELGRLMPLLPMLQARLAALIRRQNPAVCVVHGFQASLVAWPAAMLCKRTRWVYVHRTTKSASGSNPMFRLIYRPFDVVAGNSRAVTESLAPPAGRGRLATLENGLDRQGFERRARTLLAPLPESAGPVLVCVGRLMPRKGQLMLMEAFEQVADHFPGSALWIVGDGPEQEALARRAEASPARASIHLLGRRGDVPAVLAQADLFVNGSAWEGMSNAVLEGMYAGLASVVADAPGVTECHVNGETGLVVRREPGELARAVSELLADPDRRESMGRAARARVVEHYSMEANRTRYLRLFERLTGARLCPDQGERAHGAGRPSCAAS